MSSKGTGGGEHAGARVSPLSEPGRRLPGPQQVVAIAPARANDRTSPPRSMMAVHFDPACAGRAAAPHHLRTRQRRLHVAPVHGQEPAVDPTRGVRSGQAVPAQALEHTGPLPLAAAPLGSGRGAQLVRVPHPLGAAGPHQEPDRPHGAPRRTGERLPLRSRDGGGPSGPSPPASRSGKRQVSIEQPSRRAQTGQGF